MLKYMSKIGMCKSRIALCLGMPHSGKYSGFQKSDTDPKSQYEAKSSILDFAVTEYLSVNGGGEALKFQ